MRGERTRGSKARGRTALGEAGGSIEAVAVGVDVVDLGNARTRGKGSSDRFVARVLAEEEQDVIRIADDPDVELWCHWAAKEAAYKVVSKILGEPPTFIHRAFVVAWGTGDPPDEAGARLRSGGVRHGEEEVAVSVFRSGDALHALARAPRGGAGAVQVRVERLEASGEIWSAGFDELKTRLTERELDAVHHRASAAVRVAARRELAERLHVSEDRLELVCPPGPIGLRPPHVLLDGEQVAIADVSLSHDGPWIAWATWVDPARIKRPG